MNKITTGFKPAMAKRQIRNFYEYGEGVVNYIWKVVGDFSHGTERSWYSPKARNFGKIYEQKFRMSVENAKICYNNIAISAVNAYNAYAQANEIPTISIDEIVNYDMVARNYLKLGEVSGNNGETYTTTVDSVTGERVSTGEFAVFWYLEESPDTGAVGMDKATVRIALDEFKKGINKIADMINDTPMDIAFFDEEGIQIASYQAEINKMKERVTSLFDEMCNEIEKAIEEEIETLTLASQQATEALKTTTL